MNKTKNNTTPTNSELLEPIVNKPYNPDDDWYTEIERLIKLKKNGITINPVSHTPKPISSL